MFDITITSDIRDLMKPHISKYSRFSLLISSEARCFYASMASVPGILSTECTIGVKELLRFKQVWMYLSFFSFSAVARAFVDV